MSNSRKILIQLREACNIPQILEKAPNTNITIGWTLYNKKRPEISNTKLSKLIKQKINPIYNQNIYIEIPQFINKIEGYLYISLNSNQSNENLIEVYIPLNFVANFYPIHFCLKNENLENDSKILLFFSLTLFDVYDKKFNESLIEVEMGDFFFEPILLENFPFSICVNSSDFNKIEYIIYDVNTNENLNGLIIDFVEKQNPSWISYNCFFLENSFKFAFSILKSFLTHSKNLKIKIYSTDYSLVKEKSAFLQTPVAFCENIDNLCRSLFL